MLLSGQNEGKPHQFGIETCQILSVKHHKEYLNYQVTDNMRLEIAKRLGYDEASNSITSEGTYQASFMNSK